ncbi:MAG: spermidine synthase [Akkermansiaceae bacterium]|nr:spermidine synthase [Akkermansiaceae bacterium]NNM30522.1 spermidine synthase [Akkermansiaceae bacterium]
MSRLFEELDYQETPLGELILRRRRMRSLGDREIYEVILGNGYLMSSLFTTVEIALADLGLAEVEGSKLDVVVGGLGLGYTAQAALKDERIDSLLVVEFMSHVIGWHERGLVPLGEELSNDPRCRFVEGDFFALSEGEGFDPDRPDRVFDAILLDIDHSPRNLIHERHGGFYTPDGLRKFATRIRPGGVFAMWSDDPPDEKFMTDLAEVFPETDARVVRFPNPILEKDSESTVYLCRRAGRD